MLAYLSLGSNLGDRAERLAEALRLLADAGVVARGLSPVYETEPQGKRDQGWFLNCVVEVETEISPRELLARAMAVEAAMGRKRTVRWGPREIDIDILLCGDRAIDEPDLIVPHPHLRQRAFALVPLADLAPAVDVGGGATAASAAAARRAEPGQTVRRWGLLAQRPSGSVPPPPVPHPAADRPERGPDAPAEHAARRPRAGGDGSRARVLARLRAAGAAGLSGTALSRELGISRAAVWKHVHALRAQGFVIEGAAGSGYRIPAEAGETAMPLLESEIRSAGRRVVGCVLHVLGAVDSTNIRARQLGMEGSPEGTVVVAAQQSAGRGRNGRTFLSPPGGVYLSVILRPRIPPSQAVRLTLLASLAMCEALESVAGLTPSIKWPNDVLLPAGKVCGILLEMVAAEDCVDFVVLGCGINVATAPPVDGACSLWSAGVRVSRTAVASSLLDALDACYTAFGEGRWSDLLGRWRRRCTTLGQRVVVCGLDGQRVQGHAVDVTDDGALVLHTPHGVHTALAGDVRHLRRA